MRIAGLVESPDHVCCRYRLAALRPAWENAGHHLELLSLPTSFWHRLTFWRHLRDFDLVILQRRLLSDWHLTLLRRNARRLVYDFDDAVYQRDSYHLQRGVDITRLTRFTATVHAADYLVAGNDHLRRSATRLKHPSRVLHVPTCVPVTDYTPKPARSLAAEDVRLVWIGSASTLQGIERIGDWLDRIAESVPTVRLKVICDHFPKFARMPVVKCGWSKSTEAMELSSADIGISWLPDDTWSLGKCGLKVLQYMAAGLPVVANPVGVQRELVRHGETGLLAANEQEWMVAIARLAADPDLRARMGAAGRRCVEQHFSTERAAAMWLPILDSMWRRQAA